MKVQSLVKWGLGFRKIEVEVSLAPGLPTMQILGQPDKVIKESAFRIRSAFDHQGFEWPTSRQILVNLKPAHIKKVGSGLDLAIASALLWETGQVPRPEDQSPLLYGDLSLVGEVTTPEGFFEYQSAKEEFVYTGLTQESLPFGTLQIPTLSLLGSPQKREADWSSLKMERPPLSQFRFSKHLTRIMALVAYGEHSALFAGPAGTGKTTLAHAISTLLQEPEPQEILTMKKIARRFGQKLKWRPFVNPHHSMPPLSLIGGGNSPRPGEITRAHGGVLLFDELLEFQPKVIESLREPMESGVIHISRGSEVETYPTGFLFLATTNLCKCGEYVPTRIHRCKCLEKSRRAYQERLSGPLLDRIALKVLLHSEMAGETEPLETVLKRIQKTKMWKIKSGRSSKLNSRLTLKEISPTLSPASQLGLKNGFVGSQRRHLQWLQIARSLADLDQSSAIEPRHLEEARILSTLNLQRTTC